MNFTVWQAILVGLWAAFCFAGQVWGTYTNRALFISFGVGLILGDLKTAVIFGATAELAFMGFGVGPGGSTPPNPLGPGIVGSILAISMHKLSPSAALTLSYPFAMLVPFIITLIFTINSGSMASAKKAVSEGKYHKFNIMSNLTLWEFMLFAFLFGLTATLSTSALRAFVMMIPQWLMNGLTVVGGLLPAVGFALIMSTMLKKEYIPAIIFGYICVAYLKMPVIGLAFVGVALAFNNYYNRKKSGNNNQKQSNGGVENGI
ncbi:MULTISPECIES: PTS sugar transporter subunit IIC [Lactobacillus]|uniref:PTS mannose/fructose/sorbose/N-acetylgalactosamine transporter subunit IIC n=1 Tax=Lactobacillus TaxID=1578 RepID=UPI000513B6C8|nr:MULTISPECIES: PTS sugar transporter subunit IIC [unclassified Lactobacillus]KGG53705.1 PTS system, mannose-specific IIC component [Lactobacillus sp. wkB10]MBI0122007.1 PTS sugar transporter subunit IIC [Lactobacillus sp. M0398]MBI0123883.1 PTS sugar transporter subunit IIC [Lactobacillus sp. W8174]MBI0136051.1 PTS sugar transporter subunit IIC [Lactobacillus sp. W8173]